MAKAKVVGIDLFSEDITRMVNLTEEAVGSAIFEGANILANEVSAEIASLPTEDKNAYGTTNRPIRGIKSAQKIGLQHSFGIAKMQKSNGTYNVKMGFDGYNMVKTDRFPSGQPNALIARAVESGTSFRAKNQFLTRAFNRAKQVSEDIMKTVFESYYK